LTQVNAPPARIAFRGGDGEPCLELAKKPAETSMRVRDIMTRKVIGLSPQATVAEALDMMAREKVSGLPVIDDAGSLVGIVSEADFLRRAELGTAKPEMNWLGSLFLPGKAAEIYTRAHARRVDEIMSADVATIDENAGLDEAVALMESRRVKRLPVTADGETVGMIARSDFVRALALFLREPYEEGFVSDADIQRRIEADLRAQLWAPAASIRLAVENGVVSLSGVVTDQRERSAIHALVENVAGVREVHDHMIWAEPFSGTATPSPEDAKDARP
jgi:CBS domain-containing protein